MKKGFSLLEMAIILVIIGLILGIGTGAMIQLIKWNKRKETLNAINTAVNEILSQASNGSLDPKSLPEITDAYSQKIIFAIADKITKDYLNSKNATLCDLKDTEVTLEDKAYGSKINNIAVVIFSKGSDYQSDTKCNNETITSNKTCPPGSIINTDSTKDIVKYLTLPELKQFLGCVGIPLKILNDNLPTAYVEKEYKAIITAAGGIKPYKWCYKGKLPKGLSVKEENNEFIIYGTPKEEGNYPILICVQDSNKSPDGPYELSKKFLLTVKKTEENEENNEENENSSCDSYQLYFSTINNSQELLLLSLKFSYLKNNQIHYEYYIDLIFDGNTSTYTSRYPLQDFSYISVTFRWFGSSRTVLYGTAKNLDKNGDCKVFISCEIPSSYNGRNLDVITCRSE